MKHVLIVDDDERLRDLLKRFLAKNGYQVSTCPDASAADHLLQSFDFDLLIVDVMMPGEDGIHFVRRIREHMDVPVLMLTARGEVDTRIEGFEAGIDDYLAKPFEPRELILRIEAVLRRSRPSAEDARSQVLGDFVFDRAKAKLMRENETIELTRNERDLLAMLSDHRGEVLTREDLSGALADEANLRNVDVTITRLRKKIEKDPKNPHYIHTVRGQGYKFIPNP